MSSSATPSARGMTATDISKKVLFSGIGGVIGASAVYPLDYSKTLLMNQTRYSVTAVAEAVAMPNGTVGIHPPSAQQYIYKNMFDVMRTVAKTEGFRGLYAGLLANAIGVFPEKAIKISMNDYFRTRLGCDNPATTSVGKEMLAGAGAGLCQVVVTTPMELTKIRMSLFSKHHPSSTLTQMQIMKHVVREAGFKGMYTGTVSTIARDIPFSIVYFTLYGRLKNEWKDPTTGFISEWKTFSAGAIGGTIASYIATPMDVVKTTIQKSKTSLDSQGLRLVPCAQDIWRREGYRGFFKGAVPRTLIIAPLFGIVFMVYENLQKVFVDWK